MTKVHDYETTLASLGSCDDYLRSESGLPGPRGNLELADAFANVADEATIVRYAAIGPEAAPTNSQGEFLAFCGVVGLGRLVAEGRTTYLADLRRAASDPRWRLREASARALQRLGDADMPALLQVAGDWSDGNRLERRAAIAAVCEPRLLRTPETTRAVLALLDRVTASIRGAAGDRSEEQRVLRQGLGYCWSVAAAALPEEGRAAMERWLIEEDTEVRRVMRENLNKARLSRMDPDWVRSWQQRIGR